MLTRRSLITASAVGRFVASETADFTKFANVEKT
jgi:hypothetical protein